MFLFCHVLYSSVFVCWIGRISSLAGPKNQRRSLETAAHYVNTDIHKIFGRQQQKKNSFQNRESWPDAITMERAAQTNQNEKNK